MSEEFLGVGMDKPVVLAGGEIVMADASRLVAVYPYRDADYSRITLQTKNLMLISCGVPGISLDQLKEAVDRAAEFVVRFCGGEVTGVE
jgi:DNA/RNA-binding domain of Phe-tRNA-synthetase-like protein